MEIVICDICGKRENVVRRSFPYDRAMDPAGYTDDVYETFDLCPSCYISALEATIGKLFPYSKRYEFNKELIKIIKRRRQS